MNIFKKIFGSGLVDCIFSGVPIYEDTKVAGSKRIRVTCPKCYMTIYGASKRETAQKWNSVVAHTSGNR